MIDGLQGIWTRSLAGMAKDPTQDDRLVAERLELLRRRLGYPVATEWAKHVGMSTQRWNNFESGHPLSRDAAFTLCRKVPGLSLDWLYFGKPDGMPMRLASLLSDDAPPETPDTPSPSATARKKA